ncbi:MFS transporter [Aspergillus affinis]|uniref:MFS transporter n=1 Tax=Aspergillus affinis TaxID=1070780 RepID=UPI0022FF16D0|nr:uncharacterized protein KD926_004385 [Aspergillus affinis]KAI9043201.1 hypothetical protein KD926_004385 [Aspergillus affinis]
MTANASVRKHYFTSASNAAPKMHQELEVPSCKGTQWAHTGGSGPPWAVYVIFEQRWTSILMALYGAAQFIFAPISGFLSDRIESRWWPMMAGVLTLGAGTALLCAGSSIGLWVTGRLLQGAAAATVWSVACALVVDTVAGDRLGHAMSYMSMGMTLGNLAGPLTGGAVYEHGGYYAVFIVAFAFIGVDIGLRLLIVEKEQALKFLPLPVTPSSHSITAQAESGLELAGLDDHDPVSLHPHTGLRGSWELLSSLRMLIVLWACVVIAVIVSAFDSVLPLFVQDTYGWEQTAQGLIFIPLLIPSSLSPIVGWVNDRYPSSRRILAGGALMMSVPTCVLLRLVEVNDTGHKILLCALLLLLGICMGILFPLVLAESSYAASEKEQETPSMFGKQGATGLAYGFSNAAYAAGSIAGPFLAGLVRQYAGWSTMSWSLGLLTGASALPVVLYFGGLLSWRINPRQ